MRTFVLILALSTDANTPTHNQLLNRITMAFIFLSTVLLLVLFVLIVLSTLVFSTKEEKQDLIIEFGIKYRMFLTTVKVLRRHYRIQRSVNRFENQVLSIA